jgi:hypothetical protein
MTITADQATALRAIIRLFDAAGPDGGPADDVTKVEIVLRFPDRGSQTVVLFEKSPDRQG